MQYYKKKIKVSVILPVYKDFLYFEKSINSLINQSFKNFEVIIFSDGNSYSFNKKIVNLIRPYPNFKFFFSPTNKGIVNALNFLINKSKGKYIARMDADDISANNRISEQFICAEKYNPNYIFTSGCYYIDLKGKIIGEYCPKNINVNILKRKNPLIHPTLFAHRDIFKKLLYREVYLSEDYDFYYRALINNFKFKIIKKKLIFYRVIDFKKNFYSFYLSLIAKTYLQKSIANNNNLNIRYLLKIYHENYKNFKIKKKLYKEFIYKVISNKNVLSRIFFLIKNFYKDKYIFLEIYNKICILFSSQNNQKKLVYKKNYQFTASKKNTLVSVIIPTRNSEKTIKKTISSILNQSHKNLEIIVIDDGSGDDTLEILNKFKDKILLVKLNKKVLAGEARNVGIVKSKGDLIAFCDSDDIWLKNKISEQLDFMYENNFDIVCCNAISSRDNIQKPMYINFIYTQISFQDLLNKNYIINSSVLVKKKIFTKSNFYPTSNYFYSYEDYFTWLKISLKHKVGFLDKDLLIYKDNPRFSARRYSLSIYKIKLRIFLILIIFLFSKKIRFNNSLIIFKVYFYNLLKLIFNSKWKF